jgi:phosphatidylserine/phosphatidylglycerophosphate/cardiolipin synthase-like enzyme
VLGALASAVLVAPGCSTAADDSDSSGGELNAAGGTIIDAIAHQLTLRNPQDQNQSWTITQGNGVSGDWLLQMPRANFWGRNSLPAPIACTSTNCLPDFNLATCTSDAQCGGGSCVPLAATKRSDNDVPQRVCAGHSDSVLDEIYGVITRAHSTVDITSLSAPTGRFLATIRDAFDTLDKRGERVQIRVLIGSAIHDEANLPQLFGDLTRDLGPSTQLSLSVGSHRESIATWNHSKIIAVDGQEAIIGGMNLWSDHYLNSDPVHDVSIHYKGPIATAAQNFVNALWSIPCSDGHIVGLRGNGCPVAFAQRPVQAGGGLRMMGVGRLGIGQSNGFNHDPSDTALATLMSQATTSIKIAQQDIGSLRILGGTLPQSYMAAWITAAMRGVDVNIVVSNPNSFGGTGRTDADSYANGWSLAELFQGVSQLADSMFPGHHAEICQRIHFSNLRASSSATWADGSPLANHAKVVIIDDRAFYVGSQNLYEADLAEYGVIVEDSATTQQFIANYYSKLAQFSSAATFRDPSCQ